MTRGRDMAFAAASVGWLEAIQYTVLQSLRRVQKDCLGDDPADWDTIVPEMNEEVKTLLQSFHKELCEHIAINQIEAIEASGAFKEVVDDICNQRG